MMTKDQERYWTTRLIELRAKEAAIGSLPRKDQRLVERIRRLLHPECDKKDGYFRWNQARSLKFERYMLYFRASFWPGSVKVSDMLSGQFPKGLQRRERRIIRKSTRALKEKPTPPPATAPVEILTEKQFKARFEHRSIWERFADWLGDL
jgi:hypothetical protein